LRGEVCICFASQGIGIRGDSNGSNTVRRRCAEGAKTTSSSIESCHTAEATPDCGSEQVPYEKQQDDSGVHERILAPENSNEGTVGIRTRSKAAHLMSTRNETISTARNLHPVPRFTIKQASTPS